MSEADARQILCLDRGWLFHRGDIESPVPHTHIAAYMNHKAGWARGAARYNYDDSDWRTVDLPHDWSIECAPSPENHPNQGFLPRGVSWYRRYFHLDESDRGKRLAIQFDGVATHATVYVNGHLLRRHFNGYTPFTIEMADVANFGPQVNVVAVRVDAGYMEGWWYEGAGIYRHAWLIKTGPVHVDTFGVYACPERLSQTDWNTRIQTTLVNATSAAVTCELRSRLLDPAGHAVGETRSDTTIDARQSAVLEQNIPVQSPALWSLQDRNLYRIRTEVFVGGRRVDTLHTTFGYRTIRFDPDAGFFLNDQPVKLLGTCNHQDHGGLGVAVPDAVNRWRIARLREMGSNAYRAAHHPPTPELLDACDELGMLVMDENRTFGSSPEALDQLRTMVKRDRNHPCVILWSICNEESIQTTEVSGRIARAMVDEVKKLDRWRPVTAAVSGGVLHQGCIGDPLDVMSINYQLPAHDQYHARYPRRPLIASETHCVLSTRGVRATDDPAGLFASDDTAVLPWGATARDTWRFVRERSFIAGLFAWTGFDYRGEPAPARWPIVCSQVGMLDVCGFPKDAFHLHRAWWTRNSFVHLSPHWNHKLGQTIRVRAYSNCEAVELFLNGRSLGRAAVDPIEMAAWEVPFEPGELRAVAYRGEEVAATAVLQTTGAARALRLSEDDAPLIGSARAPDARIIAVYAVDEQDRPVPDASHVVAFTVEGDGRMLCVGNGDPTRALPAQSDTIALFNGLAQVIVQLRGQATLHASAPGLLPACLHIHPPDADDGRAFAAPVTRRHFITDWRRSPASPTRPDPNQRVSESDMNSWERVTLAPGIAPPPIIHDGYVIYRATFTLPRSMQAGGAELVFEKIAGEAEVFLDGSAVGKVAPCGAFPFRVTIPGSAGKRTLSVLTRGAANSGGIAGAVEIVNT